MNELRKITITVEETGEIFSIASHEFKITYPDGSTENIWSGPWNDFGEEQEIAGALLQAAKNWANKAIDKQNGYLAQNGDTYKFAQATVEFGKYEK